MINRMTHPDTPDPSTVDPNTVDPNVLDLSTIEQFVLTPELKGYPHDAAPRAIRDIGSAGWNILRGDLPFPVALLKRSALEHNLAWMADFTRDSGVLIAPHGKTTMAPQLFAQQLAAGAWGITLATMQQVSLAVRLGLRRIILANQLVARPDILQAARLLRETPGLELHVLVDSLAQLSLIEAVLPAGAHDGRLLAMIECGIDGGRTGCRSVAQAMQLARAIANSTAVALSGIECYEGLQVTGHSATDAAAVTGLMQVVQEVARQCDAEGLFHGEEIVLSAGGSAAFDVVARTLPMRLSRPVRTILRSGCYLAHDSGFYQRFMEDIRARSGARWQERPGLRPALEIWCQVQSQPEPGLAILALGKRDASFDLDLPMPFAWVHAAGREPIGNDWTIAKMNDQHAYLRFPPGPAPAVGDLIGCGISHPCTTFDKWRWLPVVDDDYHVRSAIKTFF